MAEKIEWSELHPVLQEAANEFKAWSNSHLLAMDESNKVTKPLYHYTNAVGLEGIIKTQQVWFASYLHLNDPSELTYGMALASEVLKEIGQQVDARTGFFCSMVDDLFTHENVKSVFGIFIASFSQERNDLGQWRAYGDNGRGFAIGLAPHLFHVDDKPDRKPHENVFVTPVIYGEYAGRERHRIAIEKWVEITGGAIDRAGDIMRDRAIGIPFLKTMATELIASQLIWNSLTIKHEAYAHEKEVRLIIIGTMASLKPYIFTRASGSEIVPFIKSDMPIQAKSGIAEIVVGPSATSNAEDGVKMLLQPFCNNLDGLVNKSDIPYRV